jgi:hypothetical protein
LAGIYSRGLGGGIGTIGSVNLFAGDVTTLNAFPIINFRAFSLLNTPQNNVTNAWGVLIPDLYGSTLSRAFDSNVSAGTGKFNIYVQGTANNYFKGKILVDATDNGVDIIRANGTVLSTGFKVAGAVGYLKSNGTVEAPIAFAKIVYVNATDPNSATIFDDVNPPVVNDNALKSNTSYLYVGSNSSGWVYNSSTSTYTVNTATTNASNFYFAGTSTDATGDKNSSIERPGNLSAGKIRAVSDITQLSLELGSNTNKQLLLGYDGASDKSTIQSIEQGVGYKVLVLNPLGGNVAVGSLTGTGNSGVGTDANGNLYRSSPQIGINTSTSITTDTTDTNGVGQNGHHVVINNGVSNINITCNGGVTTSYGKGGSGIITFVQGSGRTLVLLSGTAVFDGVAGSTATLWSNNLIDYLTINNY